MDGWRWSEVRFVAGREKRLRKQARVELSTNKTKLQPRSTNGATYIPALHPP